MAYIRDCWFGLVIASALMLAGCHMKPPPEPVFRSVQDCATCPKMVLIPPGSFTMGSPDDEPNRDADEGPAHQVTIAQSFAMGRTEVTRGEFAAFIKATGYEPVAGCLVWNGAKLELAADKSWQDASIPQTDEHPVVCVSWWDADSYVQWLSKTTGNTYRLPNEAEWEYAVRGGTQSAYAFPGEVDDVCAYGNVADASAKKDVPQWRVVDCDDGVGLGTAKVGSYQPNGYGLYDTVGNVWEWMGDCYHATFEGAPADGSAWSSAGLCGIAFDRGGGFSNLIPGNLRAANRSRAPSPDNGVYSLGFRVARDLTPEELKRAPIGLGPQGESGGAPR